jgi:hypothetical protein
METDSTFCFQQQLVFFFHASEGERILEWRPFKQTKFDIKVLEYLAGCKSLGLLSYFIITPLWCLVEDKNIHIMDSAKYYREIVIFIDDCVENTETFIEGGLMLSFSHFTEDVIYKTLIQPWIHDNLVVVILKSIVNFDYLCDYEKTIWRFP